MKICLLGARSTGKTMLAAALVLHFQARGRRAALAGEVLHEWCCREGRAPRPGELLAMAHEQEARVDAAAAQAEVVVADTSALMVAIHGATPDDTGLLRFALERQRLYDATLVTGLDLPHLRNGPHGDDARCEAVDARLRSTLTRAGVAYQVVYGLGAERLHNALLALGHAQPAAAPPRAWIWTCDKCSDPECEHRLFTRMVVR